MNHKKTKQVMCRYYALGQCTKGPECHFSHDENDKPSDICKFYQVGKCMYNDKCMYKHIFLPKYSRPKMTPQLVNTIKIGPHTSSSTASVKSEEQVQPTHTETEIISSFNNLTLKESENGEKYRICLRCGKHFIGFSEYLQFQEHISKCGVVPDRGTTIREMIERYFTTNIPFMCDLNVFKNTFYFG
ncbi:E3 ubiquitin-protein ligase makorin [Thelohanellus kitauei]|uniref:RING-type E3 ubiquitin transferase n=1 Tax=Thelohanellus kitauei TaxID=669202 RepID=A0A0C2MS73_THEKT|nr:E3 ubiquitin-protein ligase makorin [Thelohanellus kitauei]